MEIIRSQQQRSLSVSVSSTEQCVINMSTNIFRSPSKAIMHNKLIIVFDNYKVASVDVFDILARSWYSIPTVPDPTYGMLTVNTCNAIKNFHSQIFLQLL